MKLRQPLRLSPSTELDSSEGQVMGSKREAKKKGELLERLVALLHLLPGLEVQRNVQLPVADDDTDTREIDVLVTARPGGYKVQFPIECKNLKSKVGPDLIDGFVGKLKDVGLSPSLGIFVAVNGYTKQAIRRSVKAGIRPLILHGLTEDRLSSAVEEAFTYTVYLLPELGTIQLFDDSEGERSFLDGLSYGTGENRGREIVIHNIWHKWITGTIPREIGCHMLKLRMPAADPEVEGESKTFYAQVNVVGIVTESPGRLVQHRLEHASSGEVEKLRAELKFSEKTRVKVRAFGTSDALNEFVRTRKKARLVLGTIPIPRLHFMSFLWPISVAALERAKELRSRGKELCFENVEGVSFAEAWATFFSQDYVDTLASYEMEVEILPESPINHSYWVPPQGYWATRG